MKISALVFDLDGTAIPNRPDGKPSVKVIAAVKAAQNKISVSIATGRGITNSKYIFDALGVTAPSIIAAGTQIYDPLKEKILWQKSIPQATGIKIIELIKPYTCGIYISDSLERKSAKEIKITQNERVIYLTACTAADTPLILKRLTKLPRIAAHTVKSWTAGCFDIHITNKEATKKHAMQELLTILKVHKKEVMAVGDSDNDLPLFESAGFKVAMANSSPKLKNQADYITADVTKDGLAQAIEKYILRF